MLEQMFLALLFLLVPLVLARSYMPGAYSLALRSLRLSTRVLCGLFRYTLFGSDKPDRKRQRGAQRYTPQRSKRR